MNDTELRDRLRDLAGDAPRSFSMSPALGRRARRRVAITIVSSMLLVAAVFAGVGVGLRGLGSGRTQPAREVTEPPVARWLPVIGPLEPGTYRFLQPEEPSLQITLTVPQGWEPFEVGVLHGDGSTHMGLLFETVNGVYSDPCRSSEGFIHVGPTVGDLATALARQPRRHGSAPVAVGLDGYSGEYVELTVPKNIDFASCDGGTFHSWEGSGGERKQQGPGQHDELWILDVDGTRLVIDATYMPGTTEADRAELTELVASVHIEHLSGGSS